MRWSICWASRSPSPAPSASPRRSTATPWRGLPGLAVHHRPEPVPMCQLGWKSVGVLELTALPSIGEEAGSRGSGRPTSCWWTAATRRTCATGCGSPGWRTSLPSLPETVWVGAERRQHGDDPRIGDDFVELEPPAGRPHPGGRRLLDLPAPGPRADAREHHGRGGEWAADIAGPAYAIDDQTAIKVTDGTVEVVSEGQWRHFALAADTPVESGIMDPLALTRPSSPFRAVLLRQHSYSSSAPPLQLFRRHAGPTWPAREASRNVNAAGQQEHGQRGESRSRRRARPRPTARDWRCGL